MLLLLLIFFILVRVSLSVENPGSIQQMAEMLHGFVPIGPFDHWPWRPTVCHVHHRGPDLRAASPTFCGHGAGVDCAYVESNSPARSGAVVLVLLPLLRLSREWLRLLEAIRGSIWWISWMMLPIELISHFARILSLTVRLYANMFAGEMVTLVFFSLIPIGVPIVFMGLHLGVALIQAYVFMLLTMIYVSQAVAPRPLSFVFVAGAASTPARAPQA